MKIKLAVLWAGLLILGLWVSACTPHASITAFDSTVSSTQSASTGLSDIDNQSQHAAAVETVQSYAGQNAEVTYLKTEHFIYDPMRMVEEYLAAGYDYRVDVETGLIVEIDPVQDASFSAIKAGTEDREAGRQQAEAIIQRLDPTVKLDSLSYAENVDPGYYRLEDRSADLLPSCQYRSLQVVFATGGTFFSYVNTLTATP